MKIKIAAAVAAITALAGCQTQQRIWEAEGIIRAEPSPMEGSDYVVQILNKVDFGLNPDDKANRHKVALDYLAKQCPNGTVVDDRSIETGTYLIGGASRTYYVYVACNQTG